MTSEEREAVAQALRHVIDTYCPLWDRRIDWAYGGYAEQSRVDADFVIAAYEEASPQVPVAEMEKQLEGYRRAIHDVIFFLRYTDWQEDLAADAVEARFSPSPSPTDNGRDADVGSP
jgi:hypothetical protein